MSIIKFYANILEMLNFNPKMRFQKYSICGGWYNVFSANVSDFYQYFIYYKFKNLSLNISSEHGNLPALSNNKTYLFLSAL